MNKIKITFYFLLSLAFHSKAQSVGGTTSGGTFFCDTTNAGFISVSGHTGNIVFWQSSDNGNNWTNIPNNTVNQSYVNLKKTTRFRAVVKNGSFVADTSTVSTIQIYTPGMAGILNGGGNFCANSGAGTLDLMGCTGKVLNWESSVNNGATWSTITNTTTTQSYSNITQNINYRVIVETYSLCPNDTTNTISFKIDQNTISGNILGEDSVCYGSNGDTLKLSGKLGTILGWHSSIDGGLTWTLTNNTSSDLIFQNLTQSTCYKIEVKNGICPTETTTPTCITLYNTTPAYAGEDITITQYEPILLSGSGNGVPVWNPGISLSDSTIFSPEANPIVTTNYTLTLTDAHSCVSLDYITINVIIPIPTAFTPNGDGVNDYFIIDKIENYAQNSITIFNRWGNVIYKEAPYKNKWNGKSSNGQDLPDDVYYYILDYGNGEAPYSSNVLIKR